MIATLLTYLCLAYNFDLAYEQTDWMLWDYSKESLWYTHSDNYFGFKSDLEIRVGTKDYYGFVGGNMYNCSRVEAAPPKGFNPIFDNYQFRLGASIYCVEVGWQYNCVHPIITYVTQTSDIQWRREGSYSKFYINISGSLGGNKWK